MHTIYLSAQVDITGCGSLDYKGEQENVRVELWLEREFSKAIGDPSFLQTGKHTGFRQKRLKRPVSRKLVGCSIGAETLQTVSLGYVDRIFHKDEILKGPST